MFTDISVEMIAIIVVVIVVPILVWLISRWIKKMREAKGATVLTDNDVQEEAYHPKTPPKTNQTRIGVNAKDMVQIEYNIKNAINTFSKDDMATILANVKRMRTKYDWASLQNSLSDNFDINILTVIDKGLTPSQKKEFATWQEKLPTYVTK